MRPKFKLPGLFPEKETPGPGQCKIYINFKIKMKRLKRTDFL